MSPEIEQARKRILEGTLQRVPFDGWIWPTVEAAAEDAGFDASMARRCFPRGIRDVIAFFVADADRQMMEELDRRNLKDMKIRARIATGIRVRLEQNAPYRDAIRRALAVQATPQHGPAAVTGLARTVDLMWRAAGDQATDFNWYTKRALLGAVYSSTLLYWLDDRSTDFEATWAFLDRRINDVMTVQKLRGRLDQTVAKFDAPLKRALSNFGLRTARGRADAGATRST